jgi:hypothetical protein
VFLQPSFSYSRSCYRLTSGARLFYQQFYNFHSIDPNLKNHVFTDDFHSNVEKQSLLFFQPFVNMEIGWRYVSFFAQVNFNTQYSNPDYGSGINPYLAAGLAFRLSPDFNNR